MYYSASEKSFEKFGEYINVKKYDSLKGIDDWEGWIAPDFFFDKPAKIAFLTSVNGQAVICDNEDVCILGGSKETLLKLSRGGEQDIIRLSFGEYIRLKKETAYSVISDDNELTFCYLIVPENAVIKKI